MSVTIVPNSGIFNNEALDRSRVEALTALHKVGMKLPEAVVYYLRDIEREYLAMRHREKQSSLREVGWPMETKP